MAKGSKLTECDERQLKAIELLVSGESVSETARLVGVNRKTISDWKSREFFKAEMDRQVTELKSGIEKKILTNINPMLDKLIKIALKSDSDKTSLDAIIYSLNRIIGTPTSKVQEIKDNNTNNNQEDIEDLLEELEEDHIIIKKPNTKAI